MTREMEGEVEEMCNLSLNIYEKGIEQGIYTTAVRMLKENVPVDFIMRITGLSEEQIEKAAKSMPAEISNH